MTPGTCETCAAALDAGQRYCLSCGARVAHGAPDARDLLELAPAPVAAAGVVAAAPARGTRLAVLPGREVSLAAALGVFALVLGLAAWAGAATMRPGSAPAPVALASAAGPAPVSPATPLAPPDPLAAEPPADAAVDESAPLGELPPAETVDAATADPGAATGGDDDDDTTTTTGGDTTEPGGETAPADAPTTPELEHVWLIVLDDQGSDTLFDPAGAAPYLNGRLVPKGALLSRYHGVAGGSLADGIALVSGQGPNPATRADCPSFAALTPGTLGKDDQAAGEGCGYSSDVFTIADLVAAKGRSWRAYAGALDPVPGGAAPAACPKPEAGRPFPLPRLPFGAFRTITDDPACAERVTGLGALAGDLASARATPAFSYLVPSDCESGAATPCAPGAPAGLGPADAFLQRVVPQIQASPAYATGAIVILADHAPGGAGADRSRCCTDRTWYGPDEGTSGGGRTGALVLSPLVKGGTTVDAGLDHLDLLKTVARALGVTPPGFAAREEVAGLPREVWGAWKPGAAG